MDYNAANVIVSITDGNVTRQIGTADPIEHMDEFMEIKAKAEQAAQQYNALKIGGA
jgi:hypothetical protein